MLSILEAMREPALFARWFKDPTTWATWCVFLSALFGLPLNPAQSEVFRQCTGRSAPLAAGYVEAWLTVGRRGGKSIILALIAVYLAVFRSWSGRLVPGERGTVLVIAADRRQARVIFRYITALITETALIAPMVDGEATQDRIMRELNPDLIQLHGRETPNRVREIAQRTGAGVIKNLPVSTAGDVDAARAFDGLVEHLMFEGRPAPDAERPGGAGQVFDWSLLAGRRFERPHILAGGLDPWNVAEAVHQSGAPMVDVSSGVERGAGLKDPGLISAFLDAVRRA